MRRKTLLSIAVGAAFGVALPNLYAQSTPPDLRNAGYGYRDLRDDSRDLRQEFRGGARDRAESRLGERRPR